jgi:hypothetical protein
MARWLWVGSRIGTAGCGQPPHCRRAIRYPHSRSEANEKIWLGEPSFPRSRSGAAVWSRHYAPPHGRSWEPGCAQSLCLGSPGCAFFIAASTSWREESIRSCQRADQDSGASYAYIAVSVGQNLPLAAIVVAIAQRHVDQEDPPPARAGDERTGSGGDAPKPDQARMALRPPRGRSGSRLGTRCG